MNVLQLSSFPKNPFTRSPFWGRQIELRTIYKRLVSEPPQSCAIIGETDIGKTTLLRYLSNTESTTILDDVEKEHKFTFVYLDCQLAINLSLEDYASVLFWWNLYGEAQSRLQPKQHPRLTEPEMRTNTSPIDLIDTAFEIKSELEELIREHQHPVIFLLDNFEAVARLPLRNSEWLRSMAQRNCAYVVTSRHLLYLLYQYHPESWANPSPLWNLFSDPIYLGLMAENEVEDFLLQARNLAKELDSIWKKRDIEFIRKFAGRHAELIRIACKNLFEQRLQSGQSSETEKDESEDEFLEFSISRDASVICNQLWHGLADPELSDVPTIEGISKEKEIPTLSPHQRSLIEVANADMPTEKSILFVLEQRGLIERVNGEWRIFAEVMRQFALKQEQAYLRGGYVREQHQPSNMPAVAVQTSTTRERRDNTVFTHLEGKVYDYLKSHAGEVCDREKIKLAVWDDNLPTNTALQKIIERIREKIEPDPENPRYLIAIRGQGYMLRAEPTD